MRRERTRQTQNIHLVAGFEANVALNRRLAKQQRDRAEFPQTRLDPVLVLPQTLTFGPTPKEDTDADCRRRGGSQGRRQQDA